MREKAVAFSSSFVIRHFSINVGTVSAVYSVLWRERRVKKPQAVPPRT
jgi:hypothetical protein